MDMRPCRGRQHMGLYLMAGVYDLNTDEKIPEGYPERLLLRQPEIDIRRPLWLVQQGKRY